MKGFDPDGWLADQPGVRRAISPHHDERPGTADLACLTGHAATGTGLAATGPSAAPKLSVDLLVIHNISLPKGVYGGDAIEDLFCGSLDCSQHPSFADLFGLRVSAHFLIRRDGQIIQFVSTHHRAWHAGVSSFRGRSSCNDFSIGIELEGCDDDDFTASQMHQLAELSAVLAEHHPQLKWVAGHSDIAPGRKTDPGPHFNWRDFLSRCDQKGLTLQNPFKG